MGIETKPWDIENELAMPDNLGPFHLSIQNVLSQIPYLRVCYYTLQGA